MGGISSVSIDHINQLSPAECVKLFGELLYTNADRVGLSISNVHITQKEMPDGGIDATVEGKPQEFRDFIIDSKSFYQIKSGTNFKPWRESEIRKELLKDKEPAKKNLGNEVQRCFEQNGTYILVCMKVQLTTEKIARAEEYLKKILKECQISDPKVKVFEPEQIMKAVSRIPALTLRVSRRGAASKSHQGWATQEEMKKPLKLGDMQEKFIRTVQTELESKDTGAAIHLNVYGETGVGKTRLIFEATKKISLSHLVIYCNSPKQLIDDQLINEITRDERLEVILVIDECEQNKRTQIWDELKNLGSRIRLITIYNEYGATSGTTKQILTPNLSDKTIAEIIQTYSDAPNVNLLSKLCSGIPRFAHIIGWDLVNNSDRMLQRTPDTIDVLERYVNYGEDPSSEKVQQRKRILYTLALFKKFGYSDNFKDERDAIHILIKKIDPSITPTIMHEHISQLKKRKILQGENTLYITPKALHLWLWRKWWEDYNIFDFKDLDEGFPAQLKTWFYDMFEYSSNSDITKNIVKKFFDTDGIFGDSKSIQTPLGSRFFQILTSVDPKFAIEYLERTMGTWSSEELKNFMQGRRNVIYGLERIVLEADLFTRGGTLLRNLAEFENEGWSNSSTEVFTVLFYLGTGYLSSTRASPSTRIPLLKETLCSDNQLKRNLGLQACKIALQTKNFIKISGIQENELTADCKGWEPKTSLELGKAYLEIIDLMIEKIKEFSKEDQRKTADMIFENVRGILDMLPDIADEIIDRLEKTKDFADKEVSLQNITNILEFDKEKFGPSIKSRLEKLQIELTGTDYHSLMKRYVGMDITVDLAKENRYEERTAKIQELAKESMDISKLEPELGWLVTFDANYGHMFGQELGKIDTSHCLLPAILDAQRNIVDNGTGFFLSGYLSKIFESDKEKWNKIMIEISQDEKLIRFLSELAMRSGITDKIGNLILEMIEADKIQVIELAKFVLGRTVNRLSSEIVTKWIEYMLQTNHHKTIHIAINLYHIFFIHRQNKTLEPKLALRLLTNEAFMMGGTIQNYNVMTDHYWAETGLLFIKQHPQQSLELADKMLESMDSVSIISSHSQSLKVLDKIACTNPNETWKLVTKYIDLSFDERSFTIIRWIREGAFDTAHNFLDLVNIQNIFEWIDHDPNSRAPFIINNVKSELKKENCLARKLLIKYGKDVAVQRNLIANFMTEGFLGSRIVHYQEKKDNILKYREIENNENVKRWIDLYVKELDGKIKHEHLLAEREF